MNCSETEEKLSPVSGWKKAGSLTTLGKSGVAAPVTGISNDVLIVGGGADFPDTLPWLGGKKKYYDRVCIFEANGDSLVQTDKAPALHHPVAYAASCSTTGGLIYAGGESEAGISKQVFRLSWHADSKELASERLPDLPVALTNAGMVAYKEQVIICGGETDTGTSAKCFSLDINDMEAGWRELATLPQAVSHMILALQSLNNRDYLYLLGGRSKMQTGISDLYRDVYALDLAVNTWEKKTSLPYPVTAGTGFAADEEQIVLFGGDTGETFHRSELLSVAIKAEKDPAGLAKLNEERIELLNTHPGFSNKILLYNTRTGLCTEIGLLPFETPVTTTAVVWNDKVVLPGGEIKAGVRTPDIWSAHLLDK